MEPPLPAPTPRTRARRAQRRQAILDAAEHLASRGLEFTTEGLAEAVGIGQASLFYYFRGGRAEIEAALALRHQWALQEEWIRAVEAAPDGVEALCALLDTLRLQFERDPEVLGAVLEGQLKGAWPAELRAEHIDRINALYDLVEVRLIADRVAGRLHPDVVDPRRYCRMIVGAGLGEVLHASVIARAGGRPKHALRDAMGELVALVRRGTRCPGAS